MARRPDKVRKIYRGTSFTRNCVPLGPYSRIMPRAIGWP